MFSSRGHPQQQTDRDRGERGVVVYCTPDRNGKLPGFAAHSRPPVHGSKTRLSLNSDLTAKKAKLGSAKLFTVVLFKKECGKREWPGIWSKGLHRRSLGK